MSEQLINSDYPVAWLRQIEYFEISLDHKRRCFCDFFRIHFLELFYCVFFKDLFSLKSGFSNEALVISSQESGGGAKEKVWERSAGNKGRSSWIDYQEANSGETGDVGKDTERRTVGGRRDVAGSRDLIRARRNPLLLVWARGINDKSSRHEHRAFSQSAASLSAVVPLPLSQTFLSWGGKRLETCLSSICLWRSEILSRTTSTRIKRCEISKRWCTS